MRTELQYLKDAFGEWCHKNRWSKNLPITGGICSEVLVIADRMRAEDKKRAEAGPTT